MFLFYFGHNLGNGNAWQQEACGSSTGTTTAGRQENYNNYHNKSNIIEGRQMGGDVHDEEGEEGKGWREGERKKRTGLAFKK